MWDLFYVSGISDQETLYIWPSKKRIFMQKKYLYYTLIFNYILPVKLQNF